MKNILVFLIVLIVQNFVWGQNDSLIIKQRENYTKQCNADKTRAIEDSKTKTIYYINLAAPYDYDFLQGKELSEILKKSNIEFGGTWMGSDIAGFYTSESCYRNTMTKIANEKYGEEFFKDKIDEALKIFIKNNPNRIFDYRHDEIDHNPILLGAKNNEEEQSIFEKNFWLKNKLPKGYLKRKDGELYSSLYAYFILDQKGNISELKTEATIQNPKNQKFKILFEKKLKEYIKTLKFQPSTYKGYEVKCIEILGFNLP